MSAPNLELVPLDRRAGHALIAGSVQVGRCVVPMRFIQPGSRRVAGADCARRTGRTGRLWALGRRAPSLESPVVPSNGRAARVDIGTPPPLHCTAGGPSGAAWPWWKGRRYVRSCRGAHMIFPELRLLEGPWAMPRAGCVGGLLAARLSLSLCSWVSWAFTAASTIIGGRTTP